MKPRPEHRWKDDGSKRIGALGLSLGLFIALVPARAIAEEAIADAAPARSLGEALGGDALVRYEEGKRLYARDDFGGASKAFGAAYDASHDPRLLWNMAACEKRMRHYAKSILLVQRYLVTSPNMDAGDRREAEALVAALRPFTAPLDVQTDAPNAAVIVDDVAVGTTPLPSVLVDIGLRQVRIHKTGYADEVRDVFVDGHAAVVMNVKLTKTEARARLAVTAPAGASILVDGRSVGGGSWAGSVPAGAHVVRVTAPQKLPYEKKIVLRESEAKNVDVSLTDEPSESMPAWAWIVGGTVLAGGIAAGGYYAMHRDDIGR